MELSSVLVSYSPADRDFAEKLAGDLRMNGFVTYLQGEIEDINQCGRLVLVMSANAVEAESWQPVYQQFAVQGKLICSARIDSVTLPPVLDELEWVDFGLSYHSGVNGIKVALTTEMTQPPQLLPGFETNDKPSSRQVVISMGLAILLLIVGIVIVIFLLQAL